MTCVALLSEVLDMEYLATAFREVSPGIDVRQGADLGALDEIDIAVCWFPPHGQLAQLPRLRLAQSLAAGVDHMLADAQLPRDVPLCRIVDSGMAAGMNAYVSWAVVQQHRGMRAYVASSANGLWQEQPVVSPRKHRVGIAGMGTLGMACAGALATIGYAVRGWSRSAKADLPEGVTGYHGAGGLDAFLSGCDTLVCLLPLTPETHGFLNADLFSKLPHGAHLINVGRGDHLVEADLLQALERGQLSAATLDAFSQEPLPASHPFWKDPRILVTPHIATRTDRLVIAQQTLANLAALEQGIRPVNQVDIDRGY
ncbi:glyoxylate/hydroxypyruvate reductase A [Variovorax sp. GrIS 2.14]|uniref:2-hydroxyacid dehydrogenase n=1 Tax=Variovorax sp. GrIS 2.14 TaxID=3071709 RepID=UPI0019A23666|nr:glyoxylate/hydroxypyruvate reductase A [Variovorax sp.]